MFRINRLILTAVATLMVAAVFAGTALGTPGSGVTSATILARGTATEKLKTRGNEPYDAVVQNVVIAPGGHTGWHTHPGNVVVIVKQGTFTVYDGDDPTCSARAFSAGEVYIDPGYGHVHLGRNEGADPAELYITYLDVPPGEATRIDAANPGNCSF